METLTVLLISVTSTLGYVALGVGVFVLDPGRRIAAAWHPRVGSPQPQEAGAREGRGQR
jgi:hypothetical protein